MTASIWAATKTLTREQDVINPALAQKQVVQNVLMENRLQSSQAQGVQGVLMESLLQSSQAQGVQGVLMENRLQSSQVVQLPHHAMNG
jgi:hypothetical protein